MNQLCVSHTGQAPFKYVSALIGREVFESLRIVDIRLKQITHVGRSLVGRKLIVEGVDRSLCAVKQHP